MRKNYLIASASFCIMAGAILAFQSFPRSSGLPETGAVLGENVVADAGDIPFNLFVEGLISKRDNYGDANCEFFVSEEADGSFSSWKGELIWGDKQDYKIYFGNPQKKLLVSRGRIYALGDNGEKTEAGTVDDGGRGASAYGSIRDYVFENFLIEAGQDPSASRMLGEEVIDGTNYFILETDISSADRSGGTKRKFWVSEDGVFLKAEIEEETDGYEVYDSEGAPVEQSGYVKHITIEVAHRTFF